MADLLTRRVFPLIMAAAALACALLPQADGIEGPQRLGGTQGAQPSGTGSGASVAPVRLSATPGLLLQGRVHLTDGTALEGVVICRSLAMYPGTQVAVSDRHGEFSVEFLNIPGDEMVTIWPSLQGFSFEPPQVFWRHYYGFEARTLEFSASPQVPEAAPSAGCP